MELNTFLPVQHAKSAAPVKRRAVRPCGRGYGDTAKVISPRLLRQRWLTLSVALVAWGCVEQRGSVLSDTPTVRAPDEAAPAPDEAAPAPDEAAPEESSSDVRSPDEGVPDEGSTDEGSTVADASATPDPFPPVPSPDQLAWQTQELTAFLHFGLNTFLDQEQGNGTASPTIFNPTGLHASQWMATPRSAA